MIIERLLNRAQADELFHREAVLFGTQDEIPENRAKELFGEEAVEFAADTDGVGGYGTRDYAVFSLTYTGFLKAASYHNVELLRARMEKKGPTLNQPVKCEAENTQV